MATAEKVILDPAEVSAVGRSPLDITDWIRQEGADWGDAQITGFMADRDRGSFPVDFVVPNRDVSLPLRFSQTVGGTTTVQARANIQAKVALFQKEGGWVKRILNSGGTVYADVADAATQGFSSTAGFESAQNADIDPSISLTCLPDFYQDEITLTDHSETTNAEIIFTETGIKGDYPARVRVVVDDDQGADQKGLIWAFRSRYYDAASTAALQYEAEALGPISPATASAGIFASGGSVVGYTNLSANWTPIMNTNIGGSTFLTHKGTYRLYARVYSGAGTLVQCRVSWDVGDLVNPVVNDAWRVPGQSQYYTHDFGELRLDPSPVGPHRWQGQFQAKGDVGGEDFYVDKIWLVGVDEGFGVLTAPTPTGWGASSYSARDEFNQGGSAAVTGKVLPIGGTWTVAGTACDATDYTMTSGAATITRTAVSDTGTGPSVMVGRGITAGATSYANLSAGVDFQYTVPAGGTPAGLSQGLYARLVDTSNYVALVATPGVGGKLVYGTIAVVKVKAGVVSTLASMPRVISQATWYSLTLLIDAAGRWAGYFAPQGSIPLGGISGQDGDLATGGTLATGKAGIADLNSSATAITRLYDNFVLTVPPTDAVTFASRSTQLTSDGHFRLDLGGTAYGPVSVQTGDLPRLPVAGLEGRTTEVFLKPSRGDFDQVADYHTSLEYGDDVSARVFYRPCYLNVGTA